MPTPYGSSYAYTNGLTYAGVPAVAVSPLAAPLLVQRVYLRNETTRELVAELDAWTSVDFVDRQNDVGQWTVSVLPDSPAASLVGPGVGIVIESAYWTFAGPMLQARLREDSHGTTLVLQGESDTHWLRAVIGTIGDPSVDEFDEFTGPAESALHYFAGHAIRAQPDLDLTTSGDFGRGATGTWRARFQPVLGLMQEIAQNAGIDLGFRIVTDGQDLRFETYVGDDLSETAVLSQSLGTLISAEYVLRAPQMNFGYGLGQGTGTARPYAANQDSASIVEWFRQEGFVDASTADTADLVRQAVNAELNRSAESSTVDVVVANTSSLTIGRDYWVGDIVTVRLSSGAEIAQAVREVHVTWDESGETVTPTLGPPGARSLAASRLLEPVFRPVREMRRDVTRTQTR